MFKFSQNQPKQEVELKGTLLFNLLNHYLFYSNGRHGLWTQHNGCDGLSVHLCRSVTCGVIQVVRSQRAAKNTHARQSLRIDWAKQPNEMWWKSRIIAVKANWDVQQRQSSERAHTWVSHAQFFWLASGRENPHQCHAICHNMTPIALWMTAIACQERNQVQCYQIDPNASKCYHKVPWVPWAFPLAISKRMQKRKAPVIGIYRRVTQSLYEKHVSGDCLHWNAVEGSARNHVSSERSNESLLYGQGIHFNTKLDRWCR